MHVTNDEACVGVVASLLYVVLQCISYMSLCAGPQLVVWAGRLWMVVRQASTVHSVGLAQRWGAVPFSGCVQGIVLASPVAWLFIYFSP